MTVTIGSRVIGGGRPAYVIAEIGINHTYLFCELHYADVDGFRAQNRMNLSDLTFNAGIAFEF